MQKQTTISLWCERLMEAGWLLIITLIPIYFNLLSARHFEPDKATTLRAIVLVMVALAFIRALEKNTMNEHTARPAASDELVVTNPLNNLWKRLSSIPMYVPAIIYGLVFLTTTVTSVVPHISLWGSYQRLQGTYTNLSYVILFFIIVMTIRRKEQLQRIITVAMVSGFMVAFYGIVQHNGYDPLPWQGDVVQRVASTMGNAIFVAAYLIMIVPLALFRFIETVSNIRRAPAATNPLHEVGWGVAYGVLIVGTMALLVSAIKFGAVVRVADLRYWWVFPGAVIVSTALWVLPTLNIAASNRRPPLWPGVVFLLYLLLLGPMFLLSMNSGMQQIDSTLDKGPAWWMWLLMGVGGVSIFYVMAFLLPRNLVPRSRLSYIVSALGSGSVLSAMILTIFYSQSRGPWLGLFGSMFVFLTLLLWLAKRRAIDVQASKWLVSILRTTLWGWGLFSVAAVVFLVVFNVSDAPFFENLRKVPYFGRAGTLLASGEGTGLVRRLIWAGDEHAGGAAALITADPFRSVVGWGPESMFVAFNPFYPPALARIEARTASPDRSHQALLDELVTKGLLGLVSYLFVLISFVVLGWRIIRHSTAWEWQIFGVACLSGVTAHFIEGFTGIPIVSTLSMLWITFAMMVVGGMLAGHYSLDIANKALFQTDDDTTDNQALDTATNENATTNTKQPQNNAAKGLQKQTGGASRSRKTGRASASAASTASHRAGRAQAASLQTMHQHTSLAGMAVYAVILLFTFNAVWWLNISTIYANMRFHEGETYAEQPNSGVNGQIYGMEKYLEAIRNDPKEDFYYLNLGRSFMTLADIKNKANEVVGTENPNVKVEDLFLLKTVPDVAEFVQRSSPMELMSYARAVLKRAYDLNPLNKDHPANLARLHNFWYSWAQDRSKIEEAARWYQLANEIAPQDVALINESGNIQLMLANITRSAGESDATKQHLATAAALFERSLLFDPNYGSADSRLAEIYRMQGELDKAAALYVQTIQRKPHEFDQSIDTIAATFLDKPELLKQIRDAYQQKAGKDALLNSIAGLLSVRLGELDSAADSYAIAVESDPTHLGNVRNYTIILSDTQHYTMALEQAQHALTLAQTDTTQDRTQDIAQYQFLISYLQKKAHTN